MAPLLIPLLTTVVPEVIRYFKGDKAADVATAVSDIALDIAGVAPGSVGGVDHALSRIKDDPKLSEAFRTAVLAHEEKLKELALEDRRLGIEETKVDAGQVAAAQAMQIEALKQDDVFSKRFVYLFAIFWSVFTMLYVLFITFASIPKDSIRFADTVLGFLLGTIVASLMQFFYGTSVRSQHKDEIIKVMSQR